MKKRTAKHPPKVTPKRPAKRPAKAATKRTPKGAGKLPEALAAYRAKRDFVRTHEPRGGALQRPTGTFVVQKHAASRLHFDFRIEVDGVLKSWAVPKGVPTKPGERHLAVMVEDHPLEYGGFEGTIPQGQYGGGTVMLWDRGVYRVGGDDAARALREGKLHLYLQGQKLVGEWALVRMHGEDKQWLLLKAGEALKPQRENWERSVTTQRGMQEIAHSQAMPAFVEPMKAKPTTAPPEGEEWLYELKFDGYRFLGGKAGEETRLWSRAENDFTVRFPAVAKALTTLKAETALVDGELVVTDDEGRPSFQLIQNADAEAPVRGFLFDLLEVDGEDLRKQPLEARRARLAKLLPKRSTTLFFSAELSGDPLRLLEEVARRGLEGLIAKRRDSGYEAGRRSGAWRKIKCLLEQEFVIGGFTAPQGSRAHFGALLLGYYRGKELVFAGKAGTGFDAKTLNTLHAQMCALQTEQRPFKELPVQGSRWGSTLTRDDVSQCCWVKPQLVAQVRFTAWTEDGVLRHPAFLGLRDDKSARSVRRET